MADRSLPIADCSRNLVLYYTPLYLALFHDSRHDITLTEFRIQLCSNVYVYIVVLQSVTNKQFVVFANTEVSPSCLPSRCCTRKLIPFYTFWTLQVWAKLIFHSVTVWNAWCWMLLKPFSRAIVCFNYFKGSMWRDSEWFDLTDGSFGIESLLVK